MCRDKPVTQINKAIKRSVGVEVSANYDLLKNAPD